MVLPSDLFFPSEKKKIRCHVKSNRQNGKRGFGCFPVLRSVISIRSQCCNNDIVVFDHFAENKRPFPFKPVALFFHKLPNFFIRYCQCFFPIFGGKQCPQDHNIGPRGQYYDFELHCQRCKNLQCHE
jgi:hypothetical protein